MSNIIANTIDVNYPVAGVDNDSKGFRDNYQRIRTALTQTKTELEWFESHAVLKSPLSGTGTVVNNLENGTLTDGKFNKFYGLSNTVDVTENVVTVSLWDGIMQEFSLNQDTTITFSHWPTTGLYGNIRLHLIGSSTVNTFQIISIVSSGGGTVIQEASFPTMEIDHLSYHAIEAYTYDGGATVFVKYLGRYTLPTT